MNNMEIANNSDVFKDMISENDWQEIVKNQLNTINFKILTKGIKPFSDKQVGILGEHVILQATVATHNSKGNVSENVDLEFFGKSSPRQFKEFENFVTDTQGFLKEYKFYFDIIPDLKKHQVHGDSIWASKCYLAKQDILVLENLVKQGFRHYNCKTSIDYKHCVAVLKTLACFHAYSVVFEEKDQCSIQEKHSNILFETFWSSNEGHPGYDFMQATTRAVINLLEHQPDYKINQQKYKVIREKYAEVAKEICEFVKPSKKFRNVISHGDLWASNIFYRYNQNGEPIEVRFVDFQLFRYNPPAHDVMTFLYWVTNRNFREKYLDEMLKIYYNVFCSELEKHGLNAHELQFSWSEFKESCEVYRRAARIVTVSYYQNIMMNGDYLKTIFSNPENINMYMRIDKSKFIIENYTNDPLFREKNHEAMQEMFEYCILNQ